MDKQLSFCDATKYTRIFSNTYWGAFKIDKENNSIEKVEQTLKNRNDFITTENIKGIPRASVYSDYKNNVLGDSHFYDHIEIYTTHDKNVVIINSPYNANDEYLIENGWENYNNMYFSDVKTFIKRISIWQLKHEVSTFNKKLNNK